MADDALLASAFRKLLNDRVDGSITGIVHPTDHDVRVHLTAPDITHAECEAICRWRYDGD